MKLGKHMNVPEYFKKQPLGQNTCKNVVKDVCQTLGIRGQGQTADMTTHGLRARMISLLISDGV